jgi:hypothetical protein
MLHVACSVGVTVRAARCRAILARGMPYDCRLLSDRPECVGYIEQRSHVYASVSVFKIGELYPLDGRQSPSAWCAFVM